MAKKLPIAMAMRLRNEGGVLEFMGFSWREDPAGPIAAQQGNRAPMVLHRAPAGSVMLPKATKPRHVHGPMPPCANGLAA